MFVFYFLSISAPTPSCFRLKSEFKLSFSLMYSFIQVDLHLNRQFQNLQQGMHKNISRT